MYRVRLEYNGQTHYANPESIISWGLSGSREKCFTSNQWDGKIIFKNNDYLFIKEIFDNCDFCTGINIKIEKQCNGDFVEVFSGLFTIRDGIQEMNCAKCIIEINPKIQDFSSCITENSDVIVCVDDTEKYEILPTDLTLYNHQTILCEANYNYPFGVYPVDLDNPQFPDIDVSPYMCDVSQMLVDGDNIYTVAGSFFDWKWGFGPPFSWEYLQITTLWATETEVTNCDSNGDPVKPPGCNWQQAGAGLLTPPCPTTWYRKPHGVVISNSSLLTASDLQEIRYYEQYINGVLVPDIAANIVYNQMRSFNDIIEAVMSRAFEGCIPDFQIQSVFLGINSDLVNDSNNSYIGNKAYQYASKHITNKLFISWIEDIIFLPEMPLYYRPAGFYVLSPGGSAEQTLFFDEIITQDQTEPFVEPYNIGVQPSFCGQEGEVWKITPEEILNELELRFNLCWWMDGNILRIEHISIIETFPTKTLQPKLAECVFDLSAEQIPSNIKYSDAKEFTTPDFPPILLRHIGDCKGERPEEKRSAFITDIGYIRYDSGENFSEGYVLISACEVNGELRINRGNEFLNWCNILPNLHLDNAYTDTVEIDGIEYNACSVRRSIEQQIILEADPCVGFDPECFYDVGFGQGQITEYTWKDNCIIEATLSYNCVTNT